MNRDREETDGHRPTVRRLHRAPGDALYRLKALHGESSEQARLRAAAMPWWPRVRSKEPALSARWWCWAGKAAP